MGLDNFPHVYPCKSQGTAVLVDSKIDCDATIEAGGCPWTNANPPNGGATGMLGTYCWYRGKYGNWLVEALGVDWDRYGDFYGVDDHLTPEACTALADAMQAALEAGGWSLEAGDDEGHSDAHVGSGVEYAVWWLRWAASECEGSDSWW